MVFEHSRKKNKTKDSFNLHLNVKNKQGHRLDEEKETHTPCDVQSWKVSGMLSLTENKMHGFFDFKFFLRQGVQN
jgi:hypothetical protein